ncbi:hypothetical protein KI387_015020, partial [Taxus chinensis]
SGCRKKVAENSTSNDGLYKENDSVSVGEEIYLTPDQIPSDDGQNKIHISDHRISGYTSSGSEQRPTSSNSYTHTGMDVLQSMKHGELYKAWLWEYIQNKCYYPDFMSVRTRALCFSANTASKLLGGFFGVPALCFGSPQLSQC